MVTPKLRWLGEGERKGKGGRSRLTGGSAPFYANEGRDLGGAIGHSIPHAWEPWASMGGSRGGGADVTRDQVQVIAQHLVRTSAVYLAAGKKIESDRL